MATIETSADAFMSWASRDILATVPTENLVSVVSHPIVTAAAGHPDISEDSLSIPQIQSAGLRIKEIPYQLDGNGAGFGSRFWDLFADDNYINWFLYSKVLRYCNL